MSSSTRQPEKSVVDSGESQSRGPAVPIWLIVLMFLLLYWGALYFDSNGGWFSAKVYAPYHTVEEIQALQPVSGGSEVFELGKAVYNRPTCAACHQASGQGAPGQFPPLAGSEWVNEAEPGRMIRLVLNGLQGPITVKGQNYNNNMVPWNVLSDEEVAAVITYVRQNKEWGNNASAVTPAQVKAIREKIKNHPGAFTADELMKIAPAE
ncbi:MAG: c-type cytochrome [Verrucomicrobiota bacterium]